MDELDILAMLLANAIERDGLPAHFIRAPTVKWVLIGGHAAGMPAMVDKADDAQPESLQLFDGALSIRYDQGVPVVQGMGKPEFVPTLEETAKAVISAMARAVDDPSVISAPKIENGAQTFTRRARAVEAIRRAPSEGEETAPWMVRFFGASLADA